MKTTYQLLHFSLIYYIIKLIFLKKRINSKLIVPIKLIIIYDARIEFASGRLDWLLRYVPVGIRETV